MTTAANRDSAPVYDPSTSPQTPPAEPYDPELKKAGELASPTWELELFLSGAFVFATFQLPGLIESVFQRLEPHVTDTMEFVLFTGSLYAKAIAFTLIAMFSVHLGLRAYWVALMGLRSVFPGGVRWDNVRAGPIGREVYKRRTGNISAIIERLDNICSVVFSVGLLIVLLFVVSTTMLAGAGGISFLIAQKFNGGHGTNAVFISIFSAFVIIPTGFALWDRRFGKLYAPDSRGYHIIRRGIESTYYISPARFLGPMMWTLMSNIGQKKSMVFLYIALFTLIILAGVDRLANSDRLSINAYDFFGASRSHNVNYQFYESQREVGKSYGRTPSIQSDIIKDPYVKLFIPYSPRRHNAALLKACPSLKPLQARGIQIGADDETPDSLATPVLSCLAKMHDVKLDGASIDPQFSFYEQQATGIKGVIAYIRADSLTNGRHQLSVMPAPPAELPQDTAALRKAAWKNPYLIAFWK